MADDGEWTRRRVGSPAVIQRSPATCYELKRQIMGYPPRMRAYNERRRREENL